MLFLVVRRGGSHRVQSLGWPGDGQNIPSSLGKFLLTAFWYIQEILLVEFLDYRARTNLYCCCAIVLQLKEGIGIPGLFTGRVAYHHLS
jgi:hypothetical protein